MIIVGVRPARQSRVKLLTDTGEEFLIDKKTWEESVYSVDSSLSDSQLEELLQVSDHRRAQSRAVYLLSKRDLSRRELEQKLCREKGRYVPENKELAQQTAARMEELGYVNDAAYAERLAERYSCEKLYPRRRIVQKLIEKGIARTLAEEAVAVLETADEDLALEFLLKKHYTVPREQHEADRIAAAMARYGFAGEDIRRAMRRWMEETDNE
ncbi:MAG: regulatory protein RecX [Clostridia bacterium]|nr:regulatory protein RecX [Clostridia bacterium]